MKTTFNEVVRKYEQKQRRKKLTAILIVGLVMVNMLVLSLVLSFYLAWITYLIMKE